MQFGFALPVRGELANHEGVVEMARQGERMGFVSATVADHVVFPTVVESRYPYDASGIHPSKGDALEQLSVMAFVAGATERLRLIASVMVLPHRNPVLAAKMVATIDVLSRGRVTLGIGVGWMREELAALRAPEFEKRGAASDEYVAIFRKLWTSEGPVEHRGEHYAFAPLRFAPRPVQRPHPPIWVGGHTRPALRRTARLGDGWLPVGGVETAPLAPAEFAGLVAELRRLAAAEGRDPAAITIAFAPRLDHTAAPLPGGAGRKPFAGSSEQIAEDVETYRRLGVSHLSFDFRAATLAGTLERMDRFAREVMPLARG